MVSGSFCSAACKAFHPPWTGAVSPDEFPGGRFDNGLRRVSRHRGDADDVELRGAQKKRDGEAVVRIGTAAVAARRVGIDP